MAMTCPVCKVEKKGMCIHQKMMLGMVVLVVVAVALVLVF